MLETSLEASRRSAERSERSERSEADLQIGKGSLSESGAVGEAVGVSKGRAVEPEVIPVARRRRFSTAYKLGILERADQCREPGQVGLLLRREGLYSYHLYRWRSWRRKMAQKTNGDKEGTGSVKALRNENARLKRENQRLQLRLQRAEALIELQKKVSEILPWSKLEENGSDL